MIILLPIRFEGGERGLVCCFRSLCDYLLKMPRSIGRSDAHTKDGPDILVWESSTYSDLRVDDFSKSG